MKPVFHHHNSVVGSNFKLPATTNHYEPLPTILHPWSQSLRQGAWKRQTERSKCSVSPTKANPFSLRRWTRNGKSRGRQPWHHWNSWEIYLTNLNWWWWLHTPQSIDAFVTKHVLTVETGNSNDVSWGSIMICNGHKWSYDDGHHVFIFANPVTSTQHVPYLFSKPSWGIYESWYTLSQNPTGHHCWRFHSGGIKMTTYLLIWQEGMILIGVFQPFWNVRMVYTDKKMTTQFEHNDTTLLKPQHSINVEQQ